MGPGNRGGRAAFMPAAIATMPELTDEAREAARDAARSLYWRGWRVSDIARELKISANTIASWARRYRWKDAPARIRVECAIEARLVGLIEKEEPTGRDIKLIDLLTRQMERLAKIERYERTGKEGDLNPRVAGRNAKGQATKDAKRKNFLTDEQWDALEKDFFAGLFAHQRLWHEQRDQRTRKIKKSRQIGATWYFAREAFMKLRWSSSGGQTRNQIFLSASKRQALIFRRYITAWVRKVTGVSLTGGLGDGPMVIDLGDDCDPGELHFLSTSKATAQGEHGDFYCDEFFWIPGFTELKRVASAMATHKIYKRTYLSSASTVTHEAYPFWNGDEWNAGRRREDQRDFDVSKANLKAGAVLPDGSWCHVCDVHQAIAGGMGEFLDVDELRQEYSEGEFENLFECEEIDDTASAFPFALLGPCRVDSFYAWRDYNFTRNRPFGDAPVWLGYDPDKGGRDGAAVAVIAPPAKPGGTFRLLEKRPLKGLDFEGQNRALRSLAARYNVQDIAIDTSGAGDAVYQLVKKWFARVRRIDYSVSAKQHLVHKAQNVIRNRRFEYDAGWHDVTSAFMAIQPQLTASGKQVTFVSGRSGEHGHANIAWAVMHSLINEPLDPEDRAGRATVEFFE